MIKQLSVLVSNNPGNLFNVVEILKENNIECYGLSTYDATDFGVFHMIVDDPDRCNDVLSSKGYTVLERFVIAVRLQERFTNMSDFLKELKNARTNLDCIFTFVSHNQEPVIVFRTEDSFEVEKYLTDKGFHVYINEGIYVMSVRQISYQGVLIHYHI